MTLKWNGGGFDRPQPSSEVMMAYLVMKPCVAGGLPRAAGDIVELSETEGRALVSMGRVQPIADTVPQEKMNRSVGLEASDAQKVSKRTKRG